jgi:hypothetical protein
VEKEETETYELTIKTNDVGSENLVIDGQFNRVGISIGDSSSFSLPKGLYSVKVKVGDGLVEKPVTLTENKTVEFNPVMFNTPAPLLGTFNTSDFQINTASNYSRKEVPDVILGRGSKLFLFGSIPSGAISTDLPKKGTDPAVGLTLRTFDDDLLVDFEKPDIGTYSWDEVPWAACDIDINPGCYVLCVETNGGDVYRQTIVMSHGWQTQVFLQSRNYGTIENDVRADLINSSIMMSRIEHGFNPVDLVNFGDGTTYRLTEQVRQALQSKKKAISVELLAVLYSGKFENPMLGIYAANLLIQNNADSIFSDGHILVKNLRMLLGNCHPDVEAIALKVGIPSDYVFREFPMLAASWSWVLEASVKNSNLIPINSLAYKLAGEFWSNKFWLIWGENIKRGDGNLTNDILRLIQQDIKPQVSSAVLTLLVKATKVVASNKSKIINYLPFYKRALDGLLSNLNTNRIIEIANSLGVPHQKITELLGQLDFEDFTSAIIKFNAPISTAYNNPKTGDWGGQAENNSRLITASVVSAGISGLFNVTIRVVSTRDDLPIKGEVRFYLPDNFLNPTPIVSAKEGMATLELSGIWRAFIVGAEADDGKTTLELNLEMLPEGFKSE